MAAFYLLREQIGYDAVVCLSFIALELMLVSTRNIGVTMPPSMTVRCSLTTLQPVPPLLLLEESARYIEGYSININPLSRPPREPIDRHPIHTFTHTLRYIYLSSFVFPD